MLRRAMLAILACCGCGSSCDPGPNGPPVCTAPNDAPLAEGNLFIGSRQDDTFTPWTDGSAVDLIIGAQGGYMLTPELCVSAPGLDAQQACLLVSLDNAIVEDLEEPIEEGFEEAYEFEGQGSQLCAGPIFDFLAWNAEGLDGATLTLSAAVTGREIAASTSLTLALRVAY